LQYQQDCESLPNTPRSASPKRGTSQSSNFWHTAYQEIINDEDDKTQKMVAAYDMLLRRMIREGIQEPGDNGASGRLSEGAEGSVPVGALIPANGESEGSMMDAASEDAGLKRRVGCDEAMKAIAVANLKEMERKEWVMRWKGEVVFKVRDQVTRVVRIAKHVSSLAGQAASANPSSGLAVAGVCVLLPVSQHVNVMEPPSLTLFVRISSSSTMPTSGRQPLTALRVSRALWQGSVPWKGTTPRAATG
jgi:hypothetical protein